MGSIGLSRLWHRRGAAPIAWGIALAVSAIMYWGQEALVHFAWHLAYGAAAGLVAGAASTVARRDEAPRAPTMATWAAWALAGYAFMVVPDLLWLAGRVATGAPWEHAPWMDVFLFHVSLDAFAYASQLAPVAVTLGVAAAALSTLHMHRSQAHRPE